MRKWMNFETSIAKLKDNLREFLHMCGIRYELSDCFDCWHFEMLVDEFEEFAVNEFINNGGAYMKFEEIVYSVSTEKKIHYNGKCGFWYDDVMLNEYWKHRNDRIKIVRETETDIYVENV